MAKSAKLGMLFVVTTMLGIGAAQAQDTVRQQVTRSELQELERKLAASPSDARLAQVRERLQNGDFHDGDRIYLRVVGEIALTDSFTVRNNRKLELPDVPPISLAGVLRSELEAHLRTEIGKTLRNPQVSATSFVRIAVLGGVTRPGFYQLPAEMPLTQAVMVAGGPAPAAKLQKATLRRSGVEIADAARLGDLLARGVSIDQANVQPGDELLVPLPKSGSSIGPVLGIVSGIAGLVTAITVIAR